MKINDRKFVLIKNLSFSFRNKLEFKLHGGQAFKPNRKHEL